MSDAHHQTIKIWRSTYVKLKRLAADPPITLVELLDRLVDAELATRSVERSVVGSARPTDDAEHSVSEE